MATRTVSDAGGNWNATTTWVGGVVPINGDDVNFTSTSGNLTVNVFTANLVGINFTNYTNTITFNNSLVVQGTINLGTGGYTVSGTGLLYINAASTFSGSATWTGNVEFHSNVTTTFTLSSNLNISGTTTFYIAGPYVYSFTGAGLFNPTGSLVLNYANPNPFNPTLNLPNNINVTNLTFTSLSTSNITLSTNNNTINVSGNLSVNGNIIGTGTTSLVLTGTGIWSHSTTGQLRNNLTINSPSGTITVSGNVYYNTGTLTYTTGTVTTTGSTLNIGASTTLNTSGMTWNNVILVGTQTLSSGLNVGGNLTTQTTAVVLSGVVNVNVGGNLAINIDTSGTATIILNGTGVQTWSHGSAVYLSTSLTINKSTGTLTLGTNIYYGTGILLYTAGVVDATTNNNTLFINASTTLDTDRGATKISWNNITTSGTTLTITLSSDLTVNNTLTFAHSGTLTFSLGIYTLNFANNLVVTNGTTTLPTNFNVVNATLINSTTNAVLNGFTINISGNLTTTSTGICSGSTNLVLTGTGIWSNSSTGQIRNNLTINATAITVSGTVYYNTGILAYTAGTVNTGSSTLVVGASSTLNVNSITWNNVILSGTQTLTSGLNVGGNLTTQTTAVVLSGVFNINVGGNLTINISTSGTATIILNGVGNQTWSHGSAVSLSNNLIINKSSGTLTIGTNVYYGTGTITYTAGTVDTTTNNSTLNISASTTLNTDGINWNNLTTSGTTLTITLSSDLTVTNTLTFAHSGTLTFTLGLFSLNFANNLVVTNGTTTLPRIFNVVNATLINSTTSAVLNGFTINISGNLTTTSTGICSGTTNLVLTGTGTWSNSSTGQIRNNLTINAVTITISGTVYYNTGTLTYTAGTVNTTGSTLAIGASTTLNTNGIIWNAISWSGGTITLSSILTAIGLITASHNFPVINGSDLYANAGFNFTASNVNPNYSFISGTSTIRFEGSGSWTSPSAGTFRNNVIINPTGNFTINVYYITGTITYSNSNGGAVTSAFVTLGYNNSLSGAGGPRSTTFNTNNMRWDYIYVMDYTNSGQPGTIITCTSNLNVGLLGFANIGVGTNVNIGFSLGTGVDIVNLSNLYINGRITLNLPKDIVTDTLQFDTGIWWRVNNFSITVKRLLTIGSIAGTTSIDGTTKVIMMNNTTYQRTDSNTNPLLLNMEFQGDITFRATSAPLLTYGGSSITYTGSKYSTAKGTLLLSTNAALLNFDKLAFQNLIATSGINLTMNQFTSGSPNFKSNISASSTSNYTITFQDRTEKFAKFVKVSRATLVNPGQLTVITDNGNRGNNVGIVFAPNQKSNGLPKNTPSILESTYGSNSLLTDPSLSLL